MKAMILAAGLGTRLQPLTHTCPKALVRIGEKTLLELIIFKLIHFGITDIIVNVHHFSDQVISFIEKNESWGINVQISNESDRLLDTGGAIKKASWFFNDGEPFLVHNVDILTDLNIDLLKAKHSSSGAIATLAVRKRKTNRYLLFDGAGYLCGWQNINTNELIWVHQEVTCDRFGFSGVQMINPAIFSYLPQDEKFSLIKAYLEIAQNHRINSFVHNDSVWFDVGHSGNLGIAGRNIKDQFKGS
jgi:NDP-sugar pyrophosphorylase family protein